MVAGCPTCGLVQLQACPPVEFVVPRVPWIKYREPEQHLDDVVEQLAAVLPSDAGLALGLGPFEGPLLERLGSRGIKTVAVELLEEARRECPAGRFPYLETIQECLSLPIFCEIGEPPGSASLVSLRYILEHCHDPLAALQAMKPLIAPGGLLLIEVPDCSKFLKRLDYSFIWEEHVAYFTRDALGALAVRAGYEMISLSSYEGPLEDALVAMLRPSSRPPPSVPLALADLFSRYRDEFAAVREAYRSRLSTMTAAGEGVAILGVGHQAIMFVNALGIAPYIAMMVDDDPVKQGYAAPGTDTVIVSSAAMLADPRITTCLLAVGPRAEPIVAKKCGALLERGGQICSIFPGSTIPTLVESRR